MAEQDAPPKYVQEQLGHSSIQMTMDIYSHLFPERDREWVVKQDRERERASNLQASRNLSHSWKSSRVLSRWKIWWRCPGLNGRPAAY